MGAAALRGNAVSSPESELPLEPAIFANVGERVCNSGRVSERGMEGGNAAEAKVEDPPEAAVVKEAASALAALAIARARAATRAREALPCVSPA